MRETSRKKILTEGTFKFPSKSRPNIDPIIQGNSLIRKLRHPITETPLKSPLKARYQPSVPVVQVILFLSVTFCLVYFFTFV